MGKYALLIANNSHIDARLNGLTAPTYDVEELKSVLWDQKICAFSEPKIVPNIALVQAQKEISAFCGNRSPDDTILFYFTGHGLLDDDGRLWLAMQESDPGTPSVGSLDANYLQKAMQRCSARTQILILDCCHSGAIEKELTDGIVKAKDGPVRQAIAKDTFDADGAGRYVVASSGATQQSFEINRRSVFTRAIVEGLKTGKAAPEREEITFDDVVVFAMRAIGGTKLAMSPFYSPKESIARRKLILAKNPIPRRSLPDKWLRALNDDSDPTRRLGAIELLKELAVGKDASVYFYKVAECFSARLEIEDSVKVRGALRKNHSLQNSGSAAQGAASPRREEIASTPLDIGKLTATPRTAMPHDERNSSTLLDSKEKKERKSPNPIPFKRVLLALVVAILGGGAVYFLGQLRNALNPSFFAEGSLTLVATPSDNNNRTAIRVPGTSCTISNSTVGDFEFSVPVVGGAVVELPRSFNYKDCDNVVVRGHNGEQYASGNVGQRLSWDGRCVRVDFRSEGLALVAVLSTCEYQPNG